VKKATSSAIRDAEINITLHRLTLVACAFLPLCFATSFFGMNIKEMNTGTVHVGYFVLVAILSACFAILLSLSLGPVDSFWNATKDDYRTRHNISKDKMVSRFYVCQDWVWRHSEICKDAGVRYDEKWRLVYDEYKSWSYPKRAIWQIKIHFVVIVGAIFGYWAKKARWVFRRPAPQKKEEDSESSMSA
jgi:hypothetical protein